MGCRIPWARPVLVVAGPTPGMHVAVNAAVSADGKLSSRRRDRIAISGESDFARVDRRRAAADAVAVGSLIATVLVAEDPPLLQGVVALASLYAVQMALAILRYRTGWVPSLVDNEPLLLMDGTEVLDDNLRQASVTAGDLRAKLREANVVSLDQVEAVVMETTGDISVLHAPPEGPSLDSQLLAGVRR